MQAAAARSQAAAEPGPAIQLDGLGVRRGRQQILRDITAAVPAGQITGLLGPSGSGKTTLIRAIMGVQRIAAGSATVLGRPAGHPQLRRVVSYVTQTPSVYADLTVAQNARYFAALYGLGPAAADRAVRAVGLAEDGDRLVALLSGGQQRRASLACALVADPALIVLDEPTVGLDPALREDLWGRFRQMAADGVTLLVSSHVMDEAARCDRLILLREGAIVADETPARLLAQTGAADLDAAFLTLIQRGGSA
jgi:ABC-2 type transport system ATP-binding protein